MNANYISAVQTLTATGYYISSDIGAFNALGDGGTFGAYVTFFMRATMQVPGANPARRFLWGNPVDAAFSGWSIEIENVGGELSLQAKVGDGATYTAVQEPLTGPAVVATGQLPAAGVFERIIQASIFLDGTNLILAVNGTICNYGAFDPVATPVSPSAIAATVGAGSAAVPAFPALDCEVLSCGYTTFPGLNVAGNVAAFIGASFDAAREGCGSGFISAPAGIDWTHRYDARTLAPGRSGTLNKTSGGAVGTYAIAPQTWADIGNNGRANQLQPPIAAANLVRGGAATTTPLIAQHKNTDWAKMGTFFFTP